ncbi:CCA tRNA nucleotidyltransferase [Umbelopsis nana]
MSTADTVVPTVYGVNKTLGVEMKVVLTSREAQICDLLNDVAEHLKLTRTDLPPVTLRIAGGWVRDKLLGKDSNDLDVAVSTMMGYDFATHVNEYLKSKGYETRSIAKIDSNPDKSKHLETATTKLFDQEVDFVNLRNEVYNEDSRIPAEVTYGSPSEDAYRRDITINTLFFNVHSLEVEDYTKQGLEDLADGLIRTPLPAFKTFCDDPLRVLRCIRFASRFGFEIVDDIVQAVKDEKIKHALLAKISRERIGIEVEKMIRGPSPRRSLELIHSFGLYEIVFSPPQNIHEGTLKSTEMAIQAVRLVEWLSRNCLANLTPDKDSDQLRQLYLATNLIPYRGITYTQKGRVWPAVEAVLRDSLKTRNEDITTVSMVFKQIEAIQQAVRRNAETPIDRANLDIPAQVEQVISMYQKLIQQTHDYGIQNCFTFKPMLDGKSVAKVLSIKPGRVIGELLKEVMAWQLGHPTGSTEECQEYIKEIWQRKQQQTS